MAKVKIGINGFGRIGRLVFRACCARDDVKVVGINDPFIDVNYMAYMLRYDSVHGQFKGNIEVADGKLIVNGNPVTIFAEKDPANINWKSCGAKYIAEATGVFTTVDAAKVHIKNGGARKVVIRSFPLKLR